MSLDPWVRERRPVWAELGGIVERAHRRGVRRLGPSDARRLVYLYRDVSSDLARLRALQAPPRLVHEVNRLVTAAHGQIYGGSSGRSTGLARFFLVRYPQLFRETWKFTAASFLISLVFYAIAYRTVQSHPEVVADILGASVYEFRGDKTADDIADRFRHTPYAILSSFVTTNNIRVALTAFALGITFGLGTVYVLVINGIMLGGFAGAFARSGVAGPFWMTILPHGALELSAIVLAGGSGFIMGYALWCPGERTRVRALREESLKAVQLAVGLIPAFIIAGLIEGFVTPNDAVPPWLKVTLGVSVAAAFWSHLLFGGRFQERASKLESRL